MQEYNIEYRDKDCSMAKTFIEKLATYSVTRVRRCLMPRLVFRTKLELNENGKRKKRKGGILTLPFKPELHVKKELAVASDQQSRSPSSPRFPFGLVGRVNTRRSDNDCDVSGLTDLSLNSAAARWKIVDDYFRNGGDRLTKQEYEKMTYDEEVLRNASETEPKVLDDEDCLDDGNFTSIEDDSVLLLRNKEVIADTSSVLGMGLFQVSNDKGETVERTEQIVKQPLPPLGGVEVNANMDDHMRNVEGIMKEITGIRGHEIVRSDTETESEGGDKENTKRDSVRSQDYVRAEEKDKPTIDEGDDEEYDGGMDCGACEFEMIYEVHPKTLAKEYGSGMICVGKCGRRLLEINKKEKSNWVCKNCAEWECRKMYCVICKEESEKKSTKNRHKRKTRTS